WFGSPASPAYPPGLSRPHAAGATVQEVTLVQKFPGIDFTVNAAPGTITEVTEFGDGNAVLVTYTTDFVMPGRYGLALDASPDLDETTGKWTGKSLVPGTYTVSLSGYRDLTFMYAGELDPYFGTSSPATKDFLVGSASAIEPY